MRMLFLLAVLSFFGCSKPTAPAIQLDVAKLQEYLNLDLRVLYGQLFTDFQEQIASKLSLPNRSYEYWNLWQIKASSGKARFLLFLGAPLTNTPGTSMALIHVINEEGVLLSSTELVIGYRLDLNSVSCDYSKELNDYLIRVETFPDDGGPNICRQIYGLKQERPVLLWSEDCHGKRIESDR